MFYIVLSSFTMEITITFYRQIKIKKKLRKMAKIRELCATIVVSTSNWLEARGMTVTCSDTIGWKLEGWPWHVPIHVYLIRRFIEKEGGHYDLFINLTLICDVTMDDSCINTHLHIENVVFACDRSMVGPYGSVSQTTPADETYLFIVFSSLSLKNIKY